ncbi:hypothetical protein NONO_c62810 [Nocardia nova SH22a]|uniref:Secreted protein n=1 Tax=Nocardia nova SH22a TaxID=1415166 RepID=W5TV61_9NOCA|nr:hypothetical protein [Nocardia nova]AHH21051.1 hypothetical protein NONO_c62810 [Nocardia nova SH22a]
MSITRVASTTLFAAALVGAGFGVAQAAVPVENGQVAVAVDDPTPTEPSTGTGSASLLPTLLQALVSGSSDAGTTTTPTTNG